MQSSQKSSFVGSVLEVITDPNDKTPADAQDSCFLLNGELMTIPQTNEENELMDKTLWDYMTKISNITYVNENAYNMHIWVGGKTKVVDLNEMSQDTDISFDSRKLTYPESGVMKLFHPWTGERIQPYKPNEVTTPQTSTYYKYSPMCI